MKKFSLVFLIASFIFVLSITACGNHFANSVGKKDADFSFTETGTAEETQTISASQILEAPDPDETKAPEDPEEIPVWLGDFLPEEYLASLELNEPFIMAEREDASTYEIIPVSPNEAEILYAATNWIYLLVAPFPTLQDSVTFTQLKNIWRKNSYTTDVIGRLLVNQSTFDIFSRLWGPPDIEVVNVVSDVEILQTAWEDENIWAIIPFEEIDPRWKIIRINNISPLDSDFNPEEYSLTVQFGFVPTEMIKGDSSGHQLAPFVLPAGNFEPEKFTSLIMTGTTALVRYTALKMEENGVLYPAKDIVDLLKDADITHISNEVSFWEDCPAADPVRVEARFCSDPSYFQLLEYIDADVVELTGNHILDWGEEPFLYTLQLYKDHNLPYFGGGVNLREASTPLTLQDKSQSLTFIGCSPAGPESVWAESDSPGSNPCIEGWMETQIDQALQSGSIPVITFQHIEVEDYTPHSSQRVDFLNAAKEGAVIVSGSQSHFAQTMTFVSDSFVHYGLGNLFFDQMYGENPHEFIDKHYFYNGKYISTQLITLTLEDSSKPRVMEPSEREAFLQTIFERCNWDLTFSTGTE